ncbi:MAG: tRNA epoxyqueuosine(34) reductase QueG [Acidobacteria bacterium]|nr:tRNA epoxyqueuosine(34) reductase QueG [Acidobacteriota bacterium]
MSRLTSAAIRQKALETGFDVCGIARAETYPELTYLREWLRAGYAGEMQYMHRTAERRADVRRLLPSARSVIVAASLYNVDRPYSTEIADPGEAIVSRYAWGEDYHEVMRARLDALLDWMRAEHDGPFDARAYVDTGPVQERVYAQHAGVGWIGKNTCVINPGLGSWIFLSEIICSLDLEPDQAALDQCGSCTLCLEACPTHAIVEPWKLDATRCLSYLTIELRGSIPEPWRDAVGAHVYGCDICQDVCPWNHHAPLSLDPAWLPRPAFDRPRLIALSRRSDAELGGLLQKSAMSRAGLEGLRRNVAVALGNSRETGARGALDESDSERPSARAPLVAEHVEWARSKLSKT